MNASTEQLRALATALELGLEPEHLEEFLERVPDTEREELFDILSNFLPTLAQSLGKQVQVMQRPFEVYADVSSINPKSREDDFEDLLYVATTITEKSDAS